MKRNLNRLLSALLLCALLTAGMVVPASAARFSDVPSGHWAASAIERCVDLGLFQGKSASRFGVGEPMSRAGFAVVLTRFFGWETPEVATAPYTDVPAGAWYADAVEAVWANGAATAQSAKFRPDDPITREELAVMLVRGLGFGPISGLSQELDLPFTDVTTNRGYLTMAYDLGVVNGTGKTTFSPDKAATREQCAVMLMRLWDRLHAASGRVGVAASSAQLPDLSGMDALAVAGGALVQTGSPLYNCTIDPAEETALRDAARAAGVKTLLYVTASANSLRQGNFAGSASVLARAVENGGYDGLFLDVPGLRSAAQELSMTRLTDAVRGELGGKLFYLAVEAPAWQGTDYQGYDYATLGSRVDRLVVRVSSYAERDGKMAVAPVEPLEEVYYALRQLEDRVSPEKLSLWMTTTATVWAGKNLSDSMTGLEVKGLLEAPETQTFYSQRYGCAYLTARQGESELTVWYPDLRSARERSELARLFGVNQVCLSQLPGMDPALLKGLG